MPPFRDQRRLSTRLADSAIASEVLSQLFGNTHHDPLYSPLEKQGAPILRINGFFTSEEVLLGLLMVIVIGLKDHHHHISARRR